MPNNNSHWVTLLIIALIVSACSSTNTERDKSNASRNESNGSRYKITNDAAPANAPDMSKIEDAHPKFEPYTRAGNRKTYTVLGKNYNVLETGKGFYQTGIASWYGIKFHNHLTSNGETYDMYSMSAAHKNLPLPSYVKVTNLKNNKTVIVRVNDRGPFHDKRIIDLSYAAAYRLDMLKTGTAPVKIEVIYIENPKSITTTMTTTPTQHKTTQLHYIQVVAASNKNKIDALAQHLRVQYRVGTRVQRINQLYRLQLGPIAQQRLATQLNQKLQQHGYPDSYLVSE